MKEKSIGESISITFVILAFATLFAALIMSGVADDFRVFVSGAVIAVLIALSGLAIGEFLQDMWSIKNDLHLLAMNNTKENNNEDKGE